MSNCISLIKEKTLFFSPPHFHNSSIWREKNKRRHFCYLLYSPFSLPLLTDLSGTEICTAVAVSHVKSRGKRESWIFLLFKQPARMVSFSSWFRVKLSKTVSLLQLVLTACLFPEKAFLSFVLSNYIDCFKLLTVLFFLPQLVVDRKSVRVGLMESPPIKAAATSYNS